MQNEPNISFFSVLSVCLGMLLAWLPVVILPINTLFETADVYLFDFWFFRFVIIITLICSVLKLTFRLSCISIARHRFRCTCFCVFLPYTERRKRKLGSISGTTFLFSLFLILVVARHYRSTLM
jgi:hypothetical protein